MSLKVLKIGWEIENRIKNMNKAEIVSYMLGLKNQAKTNANDNKTVVRHSCMKIKEKLQSVDKELFILEAIGVKDKMVGKQYLLKELDAIKERIEKIWEE